jgi:site-specific DNA recombinase
MSGLSAVAVYVRISRDLAGERMGVTRQLEDCRSLAHELGWTVAEVYEDNDISAFSGRARPGYKRMLADVEAGLRDGVIAWHTDRLHRSPVELEDYIRICELHNVETRTVRAGLLDLSNANGRAVARIHGALARAESEKMSERIRRSNRQRAEQGAPRKSGRRAYGYEPDGTTLRESEARVVRELADRFLAGESLAGLTQWLNDTGVPTASGEGRWSPSAVRTILRSARISGQREYHGQILADGQWAGIITPTETLRIRRILDDRARAAARSPRRYLLTRLVVCGRCRLRMISHPQRGTARYECRSDGHLGGCGSMSITAEPLHDLIRDYVLEALDGPQLTEALARTARATHVGTEDLANRIEVNEIQLNALMEERVRGEITVREWRTARESIQKQILADRQALVDGDRSPNLRRYIGRGAALAEEWDVMTLDQQRGVISSVISQVVINPASRRGPGIDPDRVEITWLV